jgi:hypothetical protein
VNAGPDNDCVSAQPGQTVNRGEGTGDSSTIAGFYCETAVFVCP